MTRAPRRPSQYWVAIFLRLALAWMFTVNWRTMMWVVPECSRLVRYAELIQKRITRRNGALGDTNWTISPVSTFLEQTVPVLREYKVFIFWGCVMQNYTHNACAREHSSVSQFVDDVQAKCISLTLIRHAEEAQICKSIPSSQKWGVLETKRWLRFHLPKRYWGSNSFVLTEWKTWAAGATYERLNPSGRIYLFLTYTLVFGPMEE